MAKRQLDVFQKYQYILTLCFLHLNLVENSSTNDTLIIFDLDNTLWIRHHVKPPYHKTLQNEIVGSEGRTIKYYSEVPDILKKLREEGYILGVVSKSRKIDYAKQLLELFNWKKYFHYIEIYPLSKVTHFNNLRNKSGIEFKNMIFFDDRKKNIDVVSKLGVTSILVSDGINTNVIQRGLEEYKSRAES